MNCPVLFIYWSYISLKKLPFFSRQLRFLSLYCWISCSLFLSLCVVWNLFLSRSLFLLSPSIFILPRSLALYSLDSVLSLPLARYSLYCASRSPFCFSSALYSTSLALYSLHSASLGLCLPCLLLSALPAGLSIYLARHILSTLPSLSDLFPPLSNTPASYLFKGSCLKAQLSKSGNREGAHNRVNRLFQLNLIQNSLVDHRSTRREKQSRAAALLRDETDTKSRLACRRPQDPRSTQS